MYAIIEIGGKQFKVEKGDEVVVDRLDLDEGKTMQVKPMLIGGKKKAVTADELKGAKVKAKVEEHLLGEKIKVFKYKPKRGYKRSKGHRSRLSRIKIQSITAGTKKAKPAAKAEEETKAEAAAE
jgi:large subunit ribosomal protein L21